MAYDAGMLRFIVAEINEKLINGKVDKIYQSSGYFPMLPSWSLSCKT